MSAIESVDTPAGGCIGMVACPGANGCLERDLTVLKTWGASGLVTLVEAHELDTLGVSNLGESVRRHGLWWVHLPIRDRDTPGQDFENCWLTESTRFHALLTRGERFVLHCWAGLGRSGMICARLLIEMGCEPDAAINRVRLARPGTIETRSQERFLRNLGVPPQR